MIAALYVDPGGPYVGKSDVDAWTEERDARRYAGPYPVVAHPPCECWGGMRNARLHLYRRIARLRNVDPMRTADCGPIAVNQVRTWGGVLEHPAGSALWKECGMPQPGLWHDEWGGWTAEVWQGSYGHQAPKRTWLYFVGIPRSAVVVRPRVDPGGRIERMSGKGKARYITPIGFAEQLIEWANLASATGKFDRTTGLGR